MTPKELLLLGFGAYQMKKLQANTGFTAFHRPTVLESGLQALCRLQPLREGEPGDVMVLTLYASPDMPNARALCAQEAANFFFNRKFEEVPGTVQDKGFVLRSFYVTDIPTQKEIAEFVKAHSRHDRIPAAQPAGERTETYVSGDPGGGSKSS